MKYKKYGKFFNVECNNKVATRLIFFWFLFFVFFAFSKTKGKPYNSKMLKGYKW